MPNFQFSDSIFKAYVYNLHITFLTKGSSSWLGPFLSILYLFLIILVELDFVFDVFTSGKLKNKNSIQIFPFRSILILVNWMHSRTVWVLICLKDGKTLFPKLLFERNPLRTTLFSVPQGFFWKLACREYSICTCATIKFC